jgi:hypothetical protein
MINNNADNSVISDNAEHEATNYYPGSLKYDIITTLPTNEYRKDQFSEENHNIARVIPIMIHKLQL